MEQPFKVINQLRKEGRLDEAWNIGCPAVQENPQDRYLKGAFFWVCYAYLKQVQGPIYERGKANGNFLPNQVEAERINFLLDWINWLSIPAGGYEHRSLLLTCQKNLEDFPKLVLLLFSCRQGLFEAGDKAPYQSNRGESPSLMLSFARKVANCWLNNEQARQIELSDLRQFFSQVRREAGDRQHIIWLDYDEAKCLISAGNFDDARAFIIPVLKKKQSESWAWGALADTYVKTDPDTAITLFAQGINHSHDEKFALKLLTGITPLLASCGYVQQASMCIQRAVACYQSNGWKIKNDLTQFQQQPWFDASVDITELPPFLQQKAQGALDLLLGPARKACGLVVNLHKSGKGLHLYLSAQVSVSVPLRLIKSRVTPNVGDYLLATLAGEGEETSVLAAEITSPQTIPGVETYTDELRVTDKGFGFVGDTFVPPFMVKDGMNMRAVEVVRYKDFDKKKGKLGWRALSMAACD
ncbi:tetratricopeptide repeat protein [Pelagibaculum spongiae]|uniref:TOTE conflict systems S1/CSD-like domain-containing protein n=1 Tax=Pelagibaculum spongiae TaxID=2080658 RepID=A0A2V1GX96_9GAMM|nr:hypothetical protein DC094_17355 [Pelagibaculum spongiae]